MSHHEREKCARDRRNAEALIDIADAIDTSRHLIDGAFIVAETVAAEHGAPLMALLDLISERLKATSAEIQARAARERTPDAA